MANIEEQGAAIGDGSEENLSSTEQGNNLPVLPRESPNGRAAPSDPEPDSTSETTSDSNQPATSAPASAPEPSGAGYWAQPTASTSGSNQQQAAQPEQGEYLCTSCGQRFTEREALIGHEAEHLAAAVASALAAPAPFACAMCPARFSQRTQLFMHVVDAHREPMDLVMRKPFWMWFKPIGRRQVRVFGGENDPDVNGIYVLFEGPIVGVTSDNIPIGPISTRIAHHVNRNNFTLRNFWSVMRNHIIPGYNRRPGVRMFVDTRPRRFMNNHYFNFPWPQ